MTTPMPGAARRRRLLLAAGVAVLLAAAATITAVVLARPPEPASPLTAEGLFPVGVPRTVENVDLCSLLTDDEAAALLGPSTVGPGGHIYETHCIFLGDLLGTLHTYPVDNTMGYTAPGYGPNTTVAGYPAKIAIPDGYRNCQATIILEPERDRPGLGMALRSSPNCDALRAAAELMVPRLPLVPR